MILEAMDVDGRGRTVSSEQIEAPSDLLGRSEDCEVAKLVECF